MRRMDDDTVTFILTLVGAERPDTVRLVSKTYLALMPVPEEELWVPRQLQALLATPISLARRAALLATARDIIRREHDWTGVSRASVDAHWDTFIQELVARPRMREMLERIPFADVFLRAAFVLIAYKPGRDDPLVPVAYTVLRRKYERLCR